MTIRKNKMHLWDDKKDHLTKYLIRNMHMLKTETDKTLVYMVID